MFDDPRKELQRLQEELLAEEEPEFEEYEEYEEDLTEDLADIFGEEFDEADNQEPAYRSDSNGYGEFEGDEDDLDDDQVFYQEDYRQAVKDQRRAKKETLREKRQQQKQTVRELEDARQSRRAAKKKKKKSVGLLTVIALAEILAIMVVITLWIQWLK